MESVFFAIICAFGVCWRFVLMFALVCICVYVRVLTANENDRFGLPSTFWLELSPRTANT